MAGLECRSMPVLKKPEASVSSYSYSESDSFRTSDASAGRCLESPHAFGASSPLQVAPPILEQASENSELLDEETKRYLGVAETSGPESSSIELNSPTIEEAEIEIHEAEVPVAEQHVLCEHAANAEGSHGSGDIITEEAQLDANKVQETASEDTLTLAADPGFNIEMEEITSADEFHHADDNLEKHMSALGVSSLPVEPALFSFTSIPPLNRVGTERDGYVSIASILQKMEENPQVDTQETALTDSQPLARLPSGSQKFRSLGQSHAPSEAGIEETAEKTEEGEEKRHTEAGKGEDGAPESSLQAAILQNRLLLAEPEVLRNLSLEEREALQNFEKDIKSPITSHRELQGEPESRCARSPPHPELHLLTAVKVSHKAKRSRRQHS